MKNELFEELAGKITDEILNLPLVDQNTLVERLVIGIVRQRRAAILKLTIQAEEDLEKFELFRKNLIESCQVDSQLKKP